jgi:hypothetical protein
MPASATAAHTRLPHFLLVLALSGCSMNRMTANMTAGMLKDASHSLDREADVELARAAAPALLKTIDGLVLVSPENRTLLELTAQGYCSYAFGFLEDELETVPDSDPRWEALRTRTSALYERCLGYGLSLLHLSSDAFPKALDGELATLEARLAGADRDWVPGLFWVGLALASRINLNRDDMTLVADLPKAERVLARALALDPSYYNAGADLALGTIYASRGRAMGGRPDEGRRHLEAAITRTGGKFLLPKVMLARYYAVSVQDRVLYESALKEVLATPADVLPEQRLANEIARRKAARYLKQVDDLF